MTAVRARGRDAAGAEQAFTPGPMSETGPLRSLVVAHPREVFVDQRRIDAQWRDLNYLDRPELHRAKEEFDRFVELVASRGAVISMLPRDPNHSLDAIYVRDAAVITPRGAVLCNMGKAARRHEPEIMGKHLRGLGVPVLGSIVGAGRLEGGDVVWLDERRVAVGRGYRTNDEGIDQLCLALDDMIDELIVVPLPHWRGPGDVFHLMSMLSPVDPERALVYAPLLPVPFRERLLRRGTRLIEVPDEEFGTLACNVLALAPGCCLMLAGNPLTRGLLEREGVEVVAYAGREISRLGGGGPTCLTRPIRRG